jgi:hypothetical protein
MADYVSLQIDNALNTIVNTADKSGNLKKELRHDIHETVSKSRKLMFTLKSELLEEKKENQKMKMEVKELKDALDMGKLTTSARQVATSVNSNEAPTSSGTVTPAPPRCEKKKLFSEIVGRKIEERHKLTLKPRGNQMTEEIKKLLK